MPKSEKDMRQKLKSECRAFERVGHKGQFDPGAKLEWAPDNLSDFFFLQ